ncbi:MAG: CbiX/SirB N-terminal domain-containing protein [Myxococcales bacterium]|nr:CbiX/SirB N-terminal domain-containing protein [Myxococcales bacterium]
MTSAPRSDGLVVLAHGSPDPDWLRPSQAVVERIRRAAPGRPVELATLEHGPDLSAVVATLHARGCRHVAVVPLFLSAGGRHLKRDIPALVADVARACPDVDLRLVPVALGSDDAVLDALAAAAVRLGLDDG